MELSSGIFSESEAVCFISKQAGALVQLLQLSCWKVEDRGFVPRIQVSKKQNISLTPTRKIFSIVWSLRDGDVACSTSDRQGSNFGYYSSRMTSHNFNFLWRSLMFFPCLHQINIISTDSFSCGHWPPGVGFESGMLRSHKFSSCLRHAACSRLLSNDKKYQNQKGLNCSCMTKMCLFISRVHPITHCINNTVFSAAMCI